MLLSLARFTTSFRTTRFTPLHSTGGGKAIQTPRLFTPRQRSSNGWFQIGETCTLCHWRSSNQRPAVRRSLDAAVVGVASGAGVTVHDVRGALQQRQGYKVAPSPLPHLSNTVWVRCVLGSVGWCRVSGAMCVMLAVRMCVVSKRYSIAVSTGHSIHK